MEKNQPGVYGDERWPFITHFVGCEFCEGGVNPIYSPGQCIRAMERAFLFADNQVLNRYGLRHSSLHTFRVQQKKSTNSTTRSLPPPETRAHPSGIPPAADEYHNTTTPSSSSSQWHNWWPAACKSNIMIISSCIH